MYDIIYADPPWHYRNYSDTTAQRWVGDHYPVMSLDDIKRLPVGKLASDDCALFLWGTWPMLPEVMAVIPAWGFTYKTVAFVMVKENKDGSLFTGMGYWTRSNTEFCLLATRGHPKRVDASVFQILWTERLAHSAKPPEARERIVQLLGDRPRIELFARERTDGWHAWGNEIESDIVFP